MEIFNCGITESGGDAIKEALKNNFTIGKLSIGDNKLKPASIEQIQQSVIFNTQYNQMKVSNGKFQGFAYNIIAESLRTWSQRSKFVKEKLE